MKTILEYIQKKHFNRFENMIVKIDGIDCIMLKEMPGAYIYLTLPTVQHGQFKTDITGEEKPIKMTVDEMGYSIKMPESSYNQPLWLTNELFNHWKDFVEAYNNGLLNDFIEWLKMVTHDNHPILGMYKEPGSLFYFDLTEKKIQMHIAKFQETEGYCCLMYRKYKTTEELQKK